LGTISPFHSGSRDSYVLPNKSSERRREFTMKWKQRGGQLIFEESQIHDDKLPTESITNPNNDPIE